MRAHVHVTHLGGATVSQCVRVRIFLNFLKILVKFAVSYKPSNLEISRITIIYRSGRTSSIGYLDIWKYARGLGDGYKLLHT